MQQFILRSRNLSCYYSEPRFDPASGNMIQGLYLPKSYVWEEHYDPIHVLLRAVHRKEFQTSVERFNKL
jgi:E3 ubiquitin-protein ligase UBR3